MHFRGNAGGGTSTEGNDYLRQVALVKVSATTGQQPGRYDPAAQRRLSTGRGGPVGVRCRFPSDVARETPIGGAQNRTMTPAIARAAAAYGICALDETISLRKA
jgi:hypothetical protein